MKVRTNEELKNFIAESSIMNPYTKCWEWQRVKIKGGYGRLKHNYKSRLAHRVSFEVFNAPIADDALVLHKCDNPSCVNPAHLFLGDNKINSDDKITKRRDKGPSRINRDATHCVNGHEFTPANTYKRHRPGGGRICKTCVYERQGLKNA